MPDPLDIAALERIAAAELGAIAWCAPGRGYLPCPGRDLHNNANGRRDCMVTLAPGWVGSGAARKWVEAPTITCFHESCADVIAAANHRLRSAIGKAKTAAGHKGAPRASSPRTLRTDKITVRETPGGANPVSRTIRTLSPHHTRVREAEHLIEGEGIRGVSEASASPPVPKPAPDESEASGVDAREIRWSALQLRRTREPLPPGTCWITPQGSVFQARRMPDAIEIGRQICSGSEAQP